MANPKKGNVGRYVTWSSEIDRWLKEAAKKRGHNSSQELVREILRDARMADLNSQPQQQAA